MFTDHDATLILIGLLVVIIVLLAVLVGLLIDWLHRH